MWSIQRVLTKIFILLMMLCILVALGSGLFFLVKDDGKTKRTVKALSLRIAISVVLFLLLFLGFALGFIKPHGV